jgi:hypothetical protein
MLLGTIVRKDSVYCLQMASAPNCWYPLGGSSGIAADFREAFGEPGAHDVGKQLHRVQGVLQMENQEQMKARVGQ